jgi:hypothetical protein
MLRGLVGPAVSSLVAAGACLAMLRLLSPSLASTLVCLAEALAVYMACMFLIDRKGLTDDWNIARRLMKGPGSATPAQAASSS